MPPLALMIKPASSHCNLRCSYCFYTDVANHRKEISFGMMREDTLDHLVKQALAYADGWCNFTFQGGEPTLAGLDFYRAFIRSIQRHNHKQLPILKNIQTNGLLITQQWADFLTQHQFLVGLSMDGHAESHDLFRIDEKGRGSHDQVTRAARVLQDAGCEYNILCVVTAAVAKEPEAVYDALRHHRYLQFTPCIDGFEKTAHPYTLSSKAYGGFLNTLFDLYEQDYYAGKYVSIRLFDNYIYMLQGLDSENCAMQGRCSVNLVVEGDGSCYPCDFYVLDTWRLGNIMTDELSAMLKGNTAQSFVHSSLQVDSACTACRFKSICRGGCRRDRQQGLGTSLGLNRYCEAYQMFFEKNLQRLLRIARLEHQARIQSRQ